VLFCQRKWVLAILLVGNLELWKVVDWDDDLNVFGLANSKENDNSQTMFMSIKIVKELEISSRAST
jgi:hypothetical protein